MTALGSRAALRIHPKIDQVDPWMAGLAAAAMDTKLTNLSTLRSLPFEDVGQWPTSCSISEEPLFRCGEYCTLSVVGLGEAQVHLLDYMDQYPSDQCSQFILMVGRNDVPRSPGSRGGCEGGFVRLAVLFMEGSLRQVGIGEFPDLGGIVETLEQSPLLLLL